MKNKVSFVGIFIFLFISSVFLLSGCFKNEKPEQKIYETLEKIVSLEKGFQTQQSSLVKLEKKEKGLYDQIIELSMKDFNQIVKLSNDALDNLKQREDKIKKENESILASKKKFDTLKESISNIKDKKTKKKAKELYNTMEDRYAAHDNLYIYYVESLKKDEELYTMFQNKDLKLEDLQKQVDQINSLYDKVRLENEKFNKLTEQYNELKVEFSRMLK